MCGILFVRKKDKTSARKAVWRRYKKQKSRGSEGFGFIGIVNNKIKTIRRAETEKEIQKYLNKETSTQVLFHHRFPTSTPNLPEMTHPIIVKNKKLNRVFYVMHNGIISNCDTLKEKHKKMGFSYTTEMKEKIKYVTRETNYFEKTDYYNDSEAFAVELALYLSGKQNGIFVEGSIAFVTLETTKNGTVKKLHWGRNWGNPLFAENNDKFWSLRSECDDGVKIMPDILFTYDYNTKKTTEVEIDIGEYEYNIMGYTATKDVDDWNDDFYRSYGKSYSSGKNKRHKVREAENEKKILEDRGDDLQTKIEYAEDEIGTAEKMKEETVMGTEEWIFWHEYIEDTKKEIETLENEIDEIMSVSDSLE